MTQIPESEAHKPPLTPPAANRHIYVHGKQFMYTSQNAPGFTPGGITEDRFMIRGVAVDAAGVAALGYDDVLADQYFDVMSQAFDRAIALNINCIRVYGLNPAHSHRQAMDYLKAKGVYVMVGLVDAAHAVHNKSGAYDDATFAHAARLVDEFQAYDNTFCFSVGNEVEYPGNQAAYFYNENKKKEKKDQKTDAELVEETVKLELDVAQAMRSFVRDVKHHIKSQGYRTIPVGMAMQDGAQANWTNQNPNAWQRGLIGTDTIARYYTEGDNAEERADFIGINTYRYQSGGPLTAYDGLADEAKELPVPVFLSESGDIIGPTRDWKIVSHLFKTEKLRAELSGQVAYQLMEEGGGYGLFTAALTGTVLTLTAEHESSVTDLAAQFKDCWQMPGYFAANTPAHPTTAPTSFGTDPTVILKNGWPDLLPLKTYSKPDIEITVDNYNSNAKIQVVQKGQVIGVVDKAVSKETPTSLVMKAYADTALSIQYNASGNNWYEVCGLPADKISTGVVVKTNVDYGPTAVCNIHVP
ncbi:MAG: hypothetical protein NXI16_03500 [Alphaproteobacteria bacterium]|nr:hypothetical protein [Alphaproteobacteria bacterium]